MNWNPGPRTLTLLPQPAQHSSGSAPLSLPRIIQWPEVTNPLAQKCTGSPSSPASRLSLIGFVCSCLFSKCIFFLILVLQQGGRNTECSVA